jgi:beta-lactamase class C
LKNNLQWSAILKSRCAIIFLLEIEHYVKKLSLLIFFSLAQVAPALGADFSTSFETQFVRPLIDDTPGAALVVVENGRVVLEKVYGVKADGKSQPVTKQTLFRIASLSKTIASAAASRLVEDTSVSWNTPLKSNLANLKFKEPRFGAEISLEHLMSQSTGLMPHAYTNLIEENMSFRRIVDRLDRVDFVCRPGSCYGYQNVAFSLLADLVKVETSLDYATYVDQQLFTPLSMDRASFGHSEFVDDVDHATPHVWNGKRWRAVRTTSHYYKVPPAAGVNASIVDMRNWLLAQLGQQPEVLSRQMLDAMQRGVIRTSRYQAHYPYRKMLGKVYYGLGWRVFDYGDKSGFVHHGGYIKGMVSTMVFHPESQTGFVLLTNSEPRGVNELVLDFAESYGRYLNARASLAEL